MKPLKIAIGCDHAGYTMKLEIKKFLEEAGHSVWDFGTHGEERVDYPDFAHPLACAVGAGDYELGILLCGSGNGVNMVANKHQGIRSALCWSDEIALLARSHNNANVCAVPARFVTSQEAKSIVRTFIETNFEGGRHLRRVAKIPIV